jgi:hypothetical protein
MEVGMKSAHPQCQDRRQAVATVTYRVEVDGEWEDRSHSIGCLAIEPEENFRQWLKKWCPDAVFVSVSVVPDRMEGGGR